MRLSIGFASILLAPLAGADVLHVGPPGSGAPHQDIQSAIDAAAPGDLILVRRGSYDGFTLAGKGVTIAADAHAIVTVTGTVRIEDVPPLELALLSELRVLVPGTSGADACAVAGCTGPVRIERCTLRGGTGTHTTPGGDGGAGLRVASSSAVAVLGSSVRGGMGGGEWIGTSTGGRGGHGIDARDSSVAVYDCTVDGGGGGHADDLYYPDYPYENAGDGGDGAHVVGWGIFAAGTSFRGGPGGYALWGGDGGDGLFVDTDAQAQLVEVELIAGMGGPGYGFDGRPGAPLAGGGIVHDHPKSHRRLDAHRFVSAGSTAAVLVHGEPGDRVALWREVRPAHRYRAALSGVWLLAEPRQVAVGSTGVVGTNGLLVLDVPAGPLPAGEESGVEILQAVAYAENGETILTSAAHRIVLD